MTAAVLPAPRAQARLRTAGLVPALLALVVGVAAWRASAPYVVGVFHDDGVYALLARAIAEGRGFHYLQLPGRPAATHYPPLYPLALAALWRLAPAFPENVSILLALNAVCLAASAAGMYSFVRRRLEWEPVPSAIVALLAHVSTPMLTLSSALMSESLFLALLWPTLLVAEQIVISRDSDATTLVRAALMVALLMLCRTIAVSLLLAAPMLLLARGRWRHALAFGGAAGAALLPWTLWTLVASPRIPAPLAGAYGSYGSFAAAGARAGGTALVARTIGINLREVWLTIADRIAPALPGALAVPAFALFLAAIALGAWHIRKQAPVTLLSVAGYLGIVLITAFTPWRYVYALWPLLLLIAGEGVRQALLRAGALRVAPIALAAFALPLAGLLLTEAGALSRHEWERPAAGATRQIVALVEWVRTHTRPSDVILAEGGEVITLFTGRDAAPPVEFAASDYTAPPEVEHTSASLSAMLDAVPATWLVTLSPVTINAARTMSRAHPSLAEAGSFDGGVAFRVIR